MNCAFENDSNSQLYGDFCHNFFKVEKNPVVGRRLKGERLVLWGLVATTIGELGVNPVPTLADDDLGYLNVSSSMRVASCPQMAFTGCKCDKKL